MFPEITTHRPYYKIFIYEKLTLKLLVNVSKDSKDITSDIIMRRTRNCTKNRLNERVFVYRIFIIPF